MKKNKLFLGIMLIMLLAMTTSLMAQMTLVFDTNLSAGTEVTLPLYGGVNVTVDWGDGGGTEAFTTTGNKTHTYVDEGTYTVSISGSLTQFGNGNSYTNADKLTTVSSFGSIGLTGLCGAFRSTTNLATVPTTLPAAIDNLSKTFQGTGQSSITGLDSWDVSNVTDMSYMFDGASDFNQDISGWTVNNVTNMFRMFGYASDFNQNIGSWDVSKVTNMSYMFCGASAFNQNISTWTVSAVTDMCYMFFSATAFNQNIGSWDVSNVTNMYRMFYSASAFNQNISNWTVSAVTNMSEMFYNASAFNSPLLWGSNVSAVTNMSRMFQNASAFNQDISGWTVSSVTNMSYMFYNASAFNSPLLWGSNVSAVTNMSRMFQNASAFNQDISGWTVSSVTNMSSMFNNADAFSQNLDDWNVSSVTDMSSMFASTNSFNGSLLWGSDVTSVTNMSQMFYNASAFNQDISGWIVSSVTNMSRMFQNVSTFNQNIGNWTVSAVTDMSYMFYGASAFNQDIGSWNVSSVTNMSIMFQNASAFNQDISGWTVNSVANMSNMFFNATAFNQNLSNWNVSSVTNMYRMFINASAFNSPLLWGSDVSSVTDMSEMFNGASLFNQDISGWTVSSVTNMGWMFRNASAFDQNVGGWNVANVSTMTNMFWGITLSTANYDALLIGWDALELYDDVNFHGGNSKYSPGTAATARANIISTDNWTITDGGEGEPLPVTLSSFTANYVNGSSLLNWTTQSESNNLGWNIYRSETKNLDETILLNTNIIDGAGTTSLPTDYSFNDEAEIITGNSYWYWLESIEYDGTSLFYEPVKIDIPLDEDEQQPPELIVDFGLAQNYPNPFNPTTKIAFMLAEGNQHNTKIMIYNSKGQVVKIFDNLDVDSSGYGSIIWDGDDSDNNVVSSGIYLYRLITPNREYSKKMILMK